MDDELDLLRGSEGSDGPGRNLGVLVTGLVLVALLTLVGVGWVVSSVLDQGVTVTATPTTAAPTTDPAGAAVPTPADATATSGFPTALPTTTPAPAPTYSLPVLPVPSALTVVPTTRRPTPRPTPRPTVSRPPPPPTPPTPPAGLRAVPDVVGQRVRSATAVLEAAGFRVSVLGGLVRPGRDSRRVTAQQPGPGTLARAGTVVVLLTDGV